MEERVIWEQKRGRGVISPARQVAMYLCQEAGGMTLSGIARHFGLASHASAGTSIRNEKRRIEGEEAVGREIVYCRI